MGGQGQVGLVVNAVERVAFFTLGLVLVEELVETIKVGGGRAVHVVPPITDEVLLVENGAVGTEEAVEVAIVLAHVKHLPRANKNNINLLERMRRDQNSTWQSAPVSP